MDHQKSLFSTDGNSKTWNGGGCEYDLPDRGDVFSTRLTSADQACEKHDNMRLVQIRRMISCFLQSCEGSAQRRTSQ